MRSASRHASRPARSVRRVFARVINQLVAVSRHARRCCAAEIAMRRTGEPRMAQPTAFEQYFLELVNRARLDPAAEAARLGIGLNDGLGGGQLTTGAPAPTALHA